MNVNGNFVNNSEAILNLKNKLEHVDEYQKKLAKADDVAQYIESKLNYIKEEYEKAETLSDKKVSFLDNEIKALYEHITQDVAKESHVSEEVAVIQTKLDELFNSSVKEHEVVEEKFKVAGDTYQHLENITGELKNRYIDVDRRVEEVTTRSNRQESKLSNSVNYDKKLSAHLEECAETFGHQSEVQKEIKIIEQIKFYMPEVLVSQTATVQYGEASGPKGKDTLERYLPKVQLLEDDSDAERIDKLCAIQELLKNHEVPFADWRDMIVKFCINYKFRYLFYEAHHYDHFLSILFKNFDAESYIAEKRVEFNNWREQGSNANMKKCFNKLLSIAMKYPFLSNTAEEIRQKLINVLRNNYMGDKADLLLTMIQPTLKQLEAFILRNTVHSSFELNKHDNNLAVEFNRFNLNKLNGKSLSRTAAYKKPVHYSTNKKELLRKVYWCRNCSCNTCHNAFKKVSNKEGLLINEKIQ